MDRKQSSFTQVSELDDSDFLPAFGSGTNKKISKSDFVAQLKDEAQVFIYPTVSQLQSANLAADPDWPIYVRVEETEYRLYKITSLVAGANDIPLDNGATATFQEEYSEIGFVVGPSLSVDGAVALFDGESGTQLKNGPVMGVIGKNIASLDSADDTSFVKINPDESVSLRNTAQFRSDLSISNVDDTSDEDKPISDATQNALDGKVSGPSSSVNDQVALFDGITGKLIKAGQTIAEIFDGWLVQLYNIFPRTINTYADIATTTMQIGQVVYLKQHTSGGIGGGEFIGVPSVGLTPDNGLISTTASSVVFAKRIYDGPVHSDWFGCRQAANQTVALNDFLLKAGDLVIDPYPTPYMIDPTLNPLPGSNFGGLDVQSNTNLEIPVGTTIGSIPASVLFTCTIKVYNKTNVKIFGGGSVRGEKDTHIGVTGEHGMGILMLASVNVVVQDVTVDNCWGDCIYVGRATIAGVPTNCRNVLIENCELYNARRQGVSAVSVNILKLLDLTIHGIGGIAPEAAIDLEPDAGGTNTEVTISNCIGYDCGQGLVMQRSNINVTGSGNYFKARGPALAILDEAINISAPGGIYEGGMDGVSETISLDGTGFVDFSSVTIGDNVTAIGSGTNGVLKANAPINRASIDGCTLITRVAQVPLISNEGENFFYNCNLILSDLAISGASKTVLYTTKGVFGNNKWINATGETPSYLYLGTSRIVQPEIKLGEDSNTLNDWRSAKPWSPTLETTGTAFGSVTLNANSGATYTKIGDWVFIQGQLRTTALTVGSASGDVVIGNLPFPAVASTGATLDGYGSVTIGQSATWVKAPLSGLILSGESRIRLSTRVTFAGDSVPSAVADVTAGAGNIVFFSACYKTTAT